MTDRTLTIRGPLTDDEVRAFWQLMQTIEARSPTKRYKMVIDAPEMSEGIEEAMRALDELAPVAEGYARVRRGFFKKP